MPEAKSDIIARLRKDIFSLQTFNAKRNTSCIDIKSGPLKSAFYNEIFPVGVIHEFIAKRSEDTVVTEGFIAGILSSLMQKDGVALWVGNCSRIFPPALQSFGINPDKIIFIDLQKQKEILWAIEEALKCEGIAAVIGELKELNFTDSRRLQLAVEKSHVTGFILRSNPRNLNTNACVTRWEITSLPSDLPEGIPGIGFPRWNVDLLRVRNGKPGNWQIEFAAGSFTHIPKIVSIPQLQKIKTG